MNTPHPGRAGPRLLPQRALPPYSYVTGKFPHPTRQPQGHSYGVAEPQVSAADVQQWESCEPYLWGIDLFNCGYYWEAHESWEAVWHAAGRKGVIADFCKALIKLAAAGVKAREGRPQGVGQHAARALELLNSVAAHNATRDAARDRFMGQSLSSLADCAHALVRDPQAVINANDEPVVVVIPYIMLLCE